MPPTSPNRAAPKDLPAWRKAQRLALIKQRMAVAKETLIAWRQAMDRHIERGFPGLATQASSGTPAVLALCWPYRNEYDARHLAARLRRAGAVTALPVVIAPRKPLEFRAWRPGMRMAAGPLGIPYPASGGAVTPTLLILPMAGFDDAGFRLGYGGGYFDRTLAAMPRHPLVIGVAHELARLPTIYPQSHDIPVDYVVTEAGIYRRDSDSRGSRLAFLGAPPEPAQPGYASPVCYANEADPDRR